MKLERYNRLIALQDQICLEENQKLVGRQVEVLVSEGEGRKDQETHRVSGRARDGRLVHVALPAGQEMPRPGDMVTATVTHGAPHNLLADSALEGGLFSVRATRAGDAWQARQSKQEEYSQQVSLGIPAIRPRR